MALVSGWTSGRVGRLVAGAAVCALGLGAASPTVNLHEIMAGVAASQAQVLWDLAAKGTNDEGEPDAAKLSADDWMALAAGSQTLHDAAASLADARTVRVVEGAETIQDEGQPESSTSAQVQGFIDKDPAGFARHAAALRDAAADFQAAAKGRDAQKLQEASDGLAGVCEACHLDFWYPQRKEAQ
jgi:hypothetical protein